MIVVIILMMMTVLMLMMMVVVMVLLVIVILMMTLLVAVVFGPLSVGHIAAGLEIPLTEEASFGFAFTNCYRFQIDSHIGYDDFVGDFALARKPEAWRSCFGR